MIIALEIGLLYAIMALGVYLTYRVLDFPDLTVDGSFTTGAATCAMLIVGGLPVPVAMVAGTLAGMAAVLYAPINLVYTSMGHLVITKAFVIIVLGGMGSVPGAIIGGLIIGFAEAFGAFYISTDYKDIIAFALLVLILSLRPQGLFAKGAH